MSHGVNTTGWVVTYRSVAEAHDLPYRPISELA